MNSKGLESAIRLNRILMLQTLQAGKLTPTQIIACDGLLEEWAPGTYKVGDVRNFAGQTWQCCQDHDSTETPDWTPTAAPALWAAYHAADPAHARPWVAPTGAHDAYQAGEVMVWTDGKAGFKGLLKKGMILLLVWLGVLLDNAMGAAYIRTAVVLFFVGNEGLSLLENLGIMGVPIPKFMRNALEALRDKGDEGEGDTA